MCKNRAECSWQSDGYNKVMDTTRFCLLQNKYSQWMRLKKLWSIYNHHIYHTVSMNRPGTARYKALHNFLKTLHIQKKTLVNMSLLNNNCLKTQVNNRPLSPHEKWSTSKKIWNPNWLAAMSNVFFWDWVGSLLKWGNTFREHDGTKASRNVGDQHLLSWTPGQSSQAMGQEVPVCLCILNAAARARRYSPFYVHV